MQRSPFLCPFLWALIDRQEYQQVQVETQTHELGPTDEVQHRPYRQALTFFPSQTHQTELKMNLRLFS